MNKKYTSNGKPVRLLCVDGPNTTYPVIGLIEGEAMPTFWTIERGYSISTTSPKFNLVEVKEKHTMWLNIYNAADYAPDLYPSRREADKAACSGRIARIEISFTEGEGL